VAPLIGGISVLKQERVLSKGPDIIVATIGRLWDYISNVRTNVPSLSIYVQLSCILWFSPTKRPRWTSPSWDIWCWTRPIKSSNTADLLNFKTYYVLFILQRGTLFHVGIWISNWRSVVSVWVAGRPRPTKCLGLAKPSQNQPTQNLCKHLYSRLHSHYQKMLEKIWRPSWKRKLPQRKRRKMVPNQKTFSVRFTA